jgi:hypothetical protein
MCGADRTRAMRGDLAIDHTNGTFGMRPCEFENPASQPRWFTATAKPHRAKSGGCSASPGIDSGSRP